MSEICGVCSYCGRSLAETERYCWFCELDASKVRDEEERAEIFSKHSQI